jgi:uncharacterized protein
VSRLAELTEKVDAFFARVAERHGADMQCTTGCSDCCHVRLSITGVEASAIRAYVASWSDDRRRNLATTGADDRCAALDAHGRCKIYYARPLVCRSHGVPIRMRNGSLPVVQACFRNFTQTQPDPDCILDQMTLSATLLAIDAAEAAAHREQTGATGVDVQGRDAGMPRGNLAHAADEAFCHAPPTPRDAPAHASPTPRDAPTDAPTTPRDAPPTSRDAPAHASPTPRDAPTDAPTTLRDAPTIPHHARGAIPAAPVRVDLASLLAELAAI